MKSWSLCRIEEEVKGFKEGFGDDHNCRNVYFNMGFVALGILKVGLENVNDRMPNCSQKNVVVSTDVKMLNCINLSIQLLILLQSHVHLYCSTMIDFDILHDLLIDVLDTKHNLFA